MPVDNNYVILDDDGDGEAEDASTVVKPAEMAVRTVAARSPAIVGNDI